MVSALEVWREGGFFLIQKKKGKKTFIKAWLISASVEVRR